MTTLSQTPLHKADVIEVEGNTAYIKEIGTCCATLFLPEFTRPRKREGLAYNVTTDLNWEMSLGPHDPFILLARKSTSTHI